MPGLDPDEIAALFAEDAVYYNEPYSMPARGRDEIIANWLAHQDKPRETTFDLDEYVFEALRAGASGFLLKDTRPDELIQAVRIVAAGEALLAPTVTRTLIAEYLRAPTARSSPLPGVDALTERETEVLAAVARGLSNAEIAAELYMSHATAKTHVSHLLTKLQARDRAQLVVAAYEAGIVVPGAG
jgi:DNA-binding NarL/FixJ family response regulator